MRFNPMLALALALPLAACPKNQSQPSPSTVVATFAGQQITLSELDKDIAKELYETRRDGLESMVLQRLVAAEAKTQGITEEDLFEKVAAQAKNPTDDELRVIFEKFKGSLPPGTEFEAVKPMLKPRAEQEAQKVAIMDYVQDLKTKANVKFTLEPPRMDVEAIGPSRGPATAKVTIVEFSDFECPYCSKAKNTLDEVLKPYEGKVRLVFRDFPLPFHSNAAKAAEAALCADAQGKFWPMHDALFAQQEDLGIDALKGIAKKIALDEKKFSECLDGSTMAAKVKASQEAGRKAGVEGTPTFFINGRPLSGALSAEDLKAVLDEELAR